MGQKTVKVECERCGVEFHKPIEEYIRNNELGRRHFCSRSCSATQKNKEKPNINTAHLTPSNRRDEYTSFRWYIARIRQRRHKKGNSNITVEYLRWLWDEQEGKCPFTGWDLILPMSTEGHWPENTGVERASLDRINHEKGYIKGNVRFICCIANYARQSYEDKELVEFCKAVTNKCS